jgi:hypothetical protein
MRYHSELSAWLNSSMQNYADGVSLLGKLNIKIPNIQFFETDSPSKMHVNLLYNYLVNFSRVHSIKIPSKPIPSKRHSSIDSIPKSLNQSQKILKLNERPKILKNPAVDYDLLPENLKLVYDRNSKLYTEIKSLHANLKIIAGLQDKERIASLASEIVSRSKDIREGWNLIDSWWNDSLRNDPIENAKKEAISQDRRIKANLNYLRRNFGKPKFEKQLEIRIKELQGWGVAYDKLIG